MLELSSSSLLVTGLSLILVPTVARGSTILQRVLSRVPGYHDSLRKASFHAGHAHAGVPIPLTLSIRLLRDF